MKLFPLPAFSEVCWNTVHSPLFEIYSRLVRTTLNASFSTSLLPSFTTTGAVSFCPFFSFLLFIPRALRCFFALLMSFLSSFDSLSGISPMNDSFSDVRSSLPLTFVFIDSLTNNTAAGMANPITTATSSIMFLLGDLGACEPVGLSMILVLYAVNACDSSFSSLFCSRYRYNASFTDCCLSTESRFFACVGFADILELILASFLSRFCSCDFRAVMLLSIDEIIDCLNVSNTLSALTTSEFLSLLCATRLFLLSICSLYSEICLSTELFVIPDIDGIGFVTFDLSFR